MSRWIRGLLLGCALVAIAATAEAATRGGKLIYARYADSLWLDPVFNDANVDIWVLTNLYDTLLQPTADGKGVSPGLATAYQVSDDGLTFTLTLRQGTKFSDGSPITAEDVKGTLERARNPKNGIWNFILESVDSIEIKSPDTVALHLKHPDPTLAAGLATFNTAIMPQKLFDATPGATDEEKAKARRIRAETELPLLRRHPGTRDQHHGLALALDGDAEPDPVRLDHAHAPEHGKGPGTPSTRPTRLRELTS